MNWRTDNVKKYTKTQMIQYVNNCAANIGVIAHKLLAIIEVESGYDQFALNRASGSAGAYQFLATTFNTICERLEIPEDARNPYDFGVATECAGELYREIRAGLEPIVGNTMSDDIALIGMCWNWGIGHVTRNVPSETIRHIARINSAEQQLIFDRIYNCVEREATRRAI